MPLAGRGSEPLPVQIVGLLLVCLGAGLRCASGGPCANPHAYLETPKLKTKFLDCKQRHKDWTFTAIAAVRPNAGLLTAALERADKFELIASRDGAKGGEAEISKLRKLKGPNHFFVFHTIPLPDMGALNRLTQMASTEIVVLVLPGQETQLTRLLIDTAQAAFLSRPSLGLLGFSWGYDGSRRTINSPNDFKYVAAAGFGPVVVRRRAFLEVGGLSEEVCPGKCELSAAVELSVRMWGAGWSVGLHTLGKPDPPACEKEIHMEKLLPLHEEKAANETLQGMSNATTVRLTQRVPIASCSTGHPGRSSCRGSGPVGTSLILQFFNRGKNIKKIMAGIAKNTAKGVELLINDDSQSDWGAWMSGMASAGLAAGFLVYSPNIHEIRGYNRLAKLASGRMLVFMQDDDVPGTPGWLKTAHQLFKQHSSMQLLGGLRGRMDFGKIMDDKYNYVNGPKYGPPSDARNCCQKIPTTDPTTGAKFMFVYKVNMGPMLAPRSSFLQLGMYHTTLSCPGDPGIGFDFEYSIRMWYLGYSVGLYDSGFELDIGDHEKSGTRTNSKIYDIRRANELRNNKLMYSMYKGFHHSKGTGRAMSKWGQLKKGKHFVQWSDKTATADYIKTVLAKRKGKGGGAESAAKAAKKAGVLGLIKDKAITNAARSWHPKKRGRSRI